MAFVRTFSIRRQHQSVAACSNELLRAAADVATLSRHGRQLLVPVRTVADGRGAAVMHLAAEANAAEAVLSGIEREAGGATAQYGPTNTQRCSSLT